MYVNIIRMSFFAYHYIESLLLSTGGPKRRGLFNSEAVFDSTLVDTIEKQMIEYGAALGACRSELALQIISCTYKDKNWESEDAPDIRKFINEAFQSSEIIPHKVVRPISFLRHGKVVAVSTLHNKEIQAGLEQIFIEALLWGLSHPNEFKSWYDKDFEEKTSKLDKYRELGLDITYIPTLPQYLSECDKMIEDYQHKMGSLPQTIPAKLLLDAEALGVTV